MDFTEKIFFPPPCFYRLGFNFNFYNLPNIRVSSYIFIMKSLVYYPYEESTKFTRSCPIENRISRFDSRKLIELRYPLSLSNRIFFPPRSKSENELIWFLSNFLCIFFFLSTVQKEGGTQLKLQINYSNMQALFKPMRWVQFTISTFLFWFKKGTIVSTIDSRKIKNLALSRRSKLLQVIYLPPLK